MDYLPAIIIFECRNVYVYQAEKIKQHDIKIHFSVGRGNKIKNDPRSIIKDRLHNARLGPQILCILSSEKQHNEIGSI